MSVGIMFSLSAAEHGHRYDPVRYADGARPACGCGWRSLSAYDNDAAERNWANHVLDDIAAAAREPDHV